MSALRTRGIKDSRRRASPPVLTRRGIVRSAEKDARRRVSGDGVKEKIFFRKIGLRARSSTKGPRTRGKSTPPAESLAPMRFERVDVTCLE